jgi:hypothetical protein
LELKPVMRRIRFNDRYRNVPETYILGMLRLGGWAYEEDSIRAETATRAALDRWINMGLGVRRHRDARLFDPVEVINFLKWAGMEGRDTFWADHYVTTGHRLVRELASRGDDDAFKVHYRRTFHIRDAGGQVRLRMPLPLASGHLVNLVILPFSETAEDVRVQVSPGRLEARGTAPRSGDLTIGAELAFRARRSHEGEGGRLGDRETALYLRPREGLIVVSERVQALAQSLAARAGAPIDIIRAFWDHIVDELMCGAVHYDQVDADAPCDWVLESGWFDCQLGSALFVALCRARGIPARLVGGHVLYRLAPTNHYWAEAWLEDRGWTPVDFLSWDLSRGGRDAAWRDTFFGRLDHRMTTQVMPLAFTGALGLPMPPDFIVLQTASDDGIKIALSGADGTPIYTDRISFRA